MRLNPWIVMLLIGGCIGSSINYRKETEDCAEAVYTYSCGEYLGLNLCCLHCCLDPFSTTTAPYYRCGSESECAGMEPTEYAMASDYSCDYTPGMNQSCGYTYDLSTNNRLYVCCRHCCLSSKADLDDRCAATAEECNASEDSDPICDGACIGAFLGVFGGILIVGGGAFLFWYFKIRRRNIVPAQGDDSTKSQASKDQNSSTIELKRKSMGEHKLQIQRDGNFQVEIEDIKEDSSAVSIRSKHIFDTQMSEDQFVKGLPISNENYETISENASNNTPFKQFKLIDNDSTAKKDFSAQHVQVPSFSNPAFVFSEDNKENTVKIGTVNYMDDSTQHIDNAPTQKPSLLNKGLPKSHAL